MLHSYTVYTTTTSPFSDLLHSRTTLLEAATQEKAALQSTIQDVQKQLTHQKGISAQLADHEQRLETSQKERTAAVQELAAARKKYRDETEELRNFASHHGQTLQHELDTATKEIGALAKLLEQTRQQGAAELEREKLLWEVERGKLEAELRGRPGWGEVEKREEKMVQDWREKEGEFLRRAGEEKARRNAELAELEDRVKRSVEVAKTGARREVDEMRKRAEQVKFWEVGSIWWSSTLLPLNLLYRLCALVQVRAGRSPLLAPGARRDGPGGGEFSRTPHYFLVPRPPTRIIPSSSARRS